MLHTMVVGEYPIMILCPSQPNTETQQSLDIKEVACDASLLRY